MSSLHQPIAAHSACCSVLNFKTGVGVGTLKVQPGDSHDLVSNTEPLPGRSWGQTVWHFVHSQGTSTWSTIPLIHISKTQAPAGACVLIMGSSLPTDLPPLAQISAPTWGGRQTKIETSTIQNPSKRTSGYRGKALRMCFSQNQMVCVHRPAPQPAVCSGMHHHSGLRCTGT